MRIFPGMSWKLELINFQCVLHPPHSFSPRTCFYHFLIFLLAYFNEFQLAFIISFRSMRFLTFELCLYRKVWVWKKSWRWIFFVRLTFFLLVMTSSESFEICLQKREQNFFQSHERNDELQKKIFLIKFRYLLEERFKLMIFAYFLLFLSCWSFASKKDALGDLKEICYATTSLKKRKWNFKEYFQVVIMPRMKMSQKWPRKQLEDEALKTTS